MCTFLNPTIFVYYIFAHCLKQRRQIRINKLRVIHCVNISQENSRHIAFLHDYRQWHLVLVREKNHNLSNLGSCVQLWFPKLLSDATSSGAIRSFVILEGDVELVRFPHHFVTYCDTSHNIRNGDRNGDSVPGIDRCYQSPTRSPLYT